MDMMKASVVLPLRESSCIAISDCPVLDNLPISEENFRYQELSKCEGPNKIKHYVCCRPGLIRALSTKLMTIDKCPVSAAPPDYRTACCGSGVYLNKRIVGGDQISEYKYPWMALLQYELKGEINYNMHCGGSLISNKYVLTAARCAHENDVKNNIIRNVILGEYDTLDCISDDLCNDNSITVPVQTTTVHEDYINVATGNDIAMIRLKNSVKSNDFIRPICLPTFDVTEEIRYRKDFRFYVAGWGIDETGGLSQYKGHAEVPLVPSSTCAENWILSGSQICAGGAGGDSCKGDSGGPLMCLNDRQYYIIGIVSYGVKNCGAPDVPGVYTDVYKFLPWIRSQMQQ